MEMVPVHATLPQFEDYKYIEQHRTPLDAKKKQHWLKHREIAWDNTSRVDPVVKSCSQGLGGVPLDRYGWAHQPDRARQAGRPIPSQRGALPGPSPAAPPPAIPLQFTSNPAQPTPESGRSMDEMRWIRLVVGSSTCVDDRLPATSSPLTHSQPAGRLLTLNTHSCKPAPPQRPGNSRRSARKLRCS